MAEINLEEYRKKYNVMLSPEEKERMERIAKDQGWSFSKYMRVSGAILELILSKKVSNFSVAYEQVLLVETKRIDV